MKGEDDESKDIRSGDKRSALLGDGHQCLGGQFLQFSGGTYLAVTITERETGTLETPQTISMNGAISKLGTNYYLFQGYAQIPQDNPFFLAGGGTLVTLPGATTQTLVLTLNTSQLHTDSPGSSERDTGIMHVEINPSTLGGTFYEIGHDFNRAATPTPSFDPPRFTAGSLSTATPFPLSPSAMAPLNSLLLN